MNAKEKSIKYNYRYQGEYAKRLVFKGQCTERIRTRHHMGQNTLRCPEKGLKERDGMCEKCFVFNLKRLGIYPHKDNATNWREVYLVL